MVERFHIVPERALAPHFGPPRFLVIRNFYQCHRLAPKPLGTKKALSLKLPISPAIPPPEVLLTLSLSSTILLPLLEAEAAAPPMMSSIKSCIVLSKSEPELVFEIVWVVASENVMCNCVSRLALVVAG